MRRHAKASSAGTTHRQIVGLARLLAVFAAVSIAMALTASSAGAFQIHPFLETFGSAAQPSFGARQALAVNQASGEVIVGEEERLRGFNADGTPAEFSATGSNVINGFGTGDETPQGGLYMPESNLAETAIDNSGAATNGDIYSPQFYQGVVDVFASTGAYLGQLSESSEGPLSEVCGVAVDSNGAVYVGQYSGKIHKYVPAGNPVTNADNTANFSYGSGTCALAAGSGPSAGFIFADSAGGGTLSKIDSATGEVKYSIASGVRTIAADPASGHVYALTGETLREFDASGASSATEVSRTELGGVGLGVAVRGSTGNIYIAIPSEKLQVFGPAVTVPTVSAEAADGIGFTEATLHGTVNPEGLAVSECKFEYGPVSGGGFPSSAPCEGSIPTDPSDHAVSAVLSGLKDGVEYRFRLAATNANGTNHSEALNFTPPASLVVSVQAANGVTGTEATLNGTVNPEGNALSECKFEYGPDSEFNSPVDTSGYIYSAPCEGSIPTDSSDHAVSADISRLPGDGSQYRFRLVATNSFGTKATAGENFTLDTTATAEPATAITQSTATRNGTVKTDGQPLTDCTFEYGTGSSFGQSAPCTPAAGSIPVDFASHPVSASVSLEEGTTYYFRLTTINAGGTVHSNVLSLDTSGLPTTSGETALEGQTYAAIGGYVDPNGSETTYRFEWGPSASYGNTAPAGPEPSLGSGTEAVPVSAQIGGLEVGQTYHFRIVATNSSGTTEGPDHTFATYKDTGLPDARRYEQVSPVDKNGGDVDPSNLSIGMAAADGNRLLYFSQAAFAGSPTTIVAGMDYLATRGPNGWTSEGISLPGGTLFGHGGYQGFTANLTKGVIYWDENTRLGPFDPNAVRSHNLYLRDTATHSFQLVNGTLGGIEGAYPGFVWGSADLSRFIFKTDSDLIAGEPCPGSGQECTYEWDNGILRIASILPNGEAVAALPGANAFLGSGTNSMSGDGRRVFFAPGAGFGNGKVYARTDATSTTLISASERTLPGGASRFGVDYQNAEAAHGDKVLFTTRNSLVNEDTNATNDAYIYDFNKPAGKRLTLVSEDLDPEAPNGADIVGGLQGHFGGIAGASEDLQRVYFVANNQIVPGEPTAPGPKLFLWDDTDASPTVRYIGMLKNGPTFQGGDEAIWSAENSGEGGDKVTRLSPDGRYAAFVSHARLTPFDNEGKAEIYRYDAVAESLDCVSCPADPATPTPTLERPNEFGRIDRFNHANPFNRELHNVSESGQVFFNSEWDLLPRDANGKRDVYEYENGQLHLISRGNGEEDSTLIDASTSGSDVFFVTRDRLVGWDKDQNFDAYDARVSGGFPEPGETPACNGDACQPAPIVPNDPTPASSSFQGAGNVTESSAGRCAVGKVRRHGKCLKKRHAKKHAKHRRHATRSHG